MLEKSKSLYNVEMITVFPRRNNFSLSMLNQRRSLKLKQHWFLVDHKNIFVLMFRSNFDGRIVGVILMHILDSTCFFWYVFKRKKIVVALSVIDKFLIFQKWESLGRVFSIYSHFDVVFQSNFVPLWKILRDYTVLKGSYTGQYLLWFNLSAVTVVFS